MKARHLYTTLHHGRAIQTREALNSKSLYWVGRRAFKSLKEAKAHIDNDRQLGFHGMLVKPRPR